METFKRFLAVIIPVAAFIVAIRKESLILEYMSLYTIMILGFTCVILLNLWIYFRLSDRQKETKKKVLTLKGYRDYEYEWLHKEMKRQFTVTNTAIYTIANHLQIGKAEENLPEKILIEDRNNEHSEKRNYYNKEMNEWTF